MQNSFITKNSINRSLIFALSILVLSVFLSVQLGCNNPYLHNRPSDKACKEWLSGQKIVLEKGLLLDDTWTIQTKEFTEFQIKSITSADGQNLATVQFDLRSGQRGLSVEGTIAYRMNDSKEVVVFLRFTPTKIQKLGKW